MAFMLIYKDPRKQKLQRLQVVLMLLLLPVGLFGAFKAYGVYAAYSRADAKYLAAEQMMDGNRWLDASKLLHEAVIEYPEHYAAWDALSTCYHMQGDFTHARDVLAEGLTHLPDEGRLHREYGQALHQLGDHQSEKLSLEKAQALMPDDPLTFRLLKRSTACPATGTPAQK